MGAADRQLPRPHPGDALEARGRLVGITTASVIHEQIQAERYEALAELSSEGNAGTFLGEIREEFEALYDDAEAEGAASTAGHGEPAAGRQWGGKAEQ